MKGWRGRKETMERQAWRKSRRRKGRESERETRGAEKGWRGAMLWGGERSGRGNRCITHSQSIKRGIREDYANIFRSRERQTNNRLNDYLYLKYLLPPFPPSSVSSSFFSFTPLPLLSPSTSFFFLLFLSMFLTPLIKLSLTSFFLLPPFLFFFLPCFSSFSYIVLFSVPFRLFPSPSVLFSFIYLSFSFTFYNSLSLPVSLCIYLSVSTPFHSVQFPTSSGASLLCFHTRSSFWLLLLEPFLPTFSSSPVAHLP